MKHFYEALEELNKVDNIITEDLEHWAKRNYPNMFGDGVGDARKQKEAMSQLVALAKLDPTYKDTLSDEELLAGNQGPYVPWLIRAMKNTSYEEVMQNAHEYKDQLSAFDDLKKRNRLPQDKKDIMQFRTLDNLIEMIMSLGGQSETGGHSDFKQDIADIRAGLKKICKLEERDIPENIQRTEDVLEFLGENDTWEIWGAKNEFGTMLFDSWGNGAGWCVGGMLGNNHGAEQLRQARNYFTHYNQGGATYVCFQQKDKNASRPTNKYLITLGPNGSEPATSAGYQFNDSNNITQYGEYGEDSNDYQLDAFAKFLAANGLTDVFKKTRFKDCACFLNIENKQRLENGEPYKYAGGRIKVYLKTAIDKIIFVDEEGKEHNVSAVEHKEYLECESVIEMVNMENLFNGEPYVYDGTTKSVPEKFRPLIKEVIVPDYYAQTVRWQQSEFVGIPYEAFKGCVNMTKCTFPANVIVLATGCFRVNGYNGSYTNIELYTPKHRIKCSDGDDVEFYKKHLHYTNGE